MSLQCLRTGGCVIIAVALVCPCVVGVHDEISTGSDEGELYDDPITVNGFTVTKGMDVCIMSVSAGQWFEARVVATSIKNEKHLVQIHYSDPLNCPEGIIELENTREQAPNNKYHKTINVADPEKAAQITQSCKWGEMHTTELERLEDAYDDAEVREEEDTDFEEVEDLDPDADVEEETDLKAGEKGVERKQVQEADCDEGPGTVKTVEIIGYSQGEAENEDEDDFGTFVLAKMGQDGRYINPGGPNTFINCPENWQVDESAMKDTGVKAILGDGLLPGQLELDSSYLKKEMAVSSNTRRLFSLEIEPTTVLEDYWEGEGIEQLMCLNPTDMNLEYEFEQTLITMGICDQSM